MKNFKINIIILTDSGWRRRNEVPVITLKMHKFLLKEKHAKLCDFSLNLGLLKKLRLNGVNNDFVNVENGTVITSKIISSCCCISLW